MKRMMTRATGERAAGVLVFAINLGVAWIGSRRWKEFFIRVSLLVIASCLDDLLEECQLNKK